MAITSSRWIFSPLIQHFIIVDTDAYGSASTAPDTSKIEVSTKPYCTVFIRLTIKKLCYKVLVLFHKMEDEQRSKYLYLKELKKYYSIKIYSKLWKKIKINTIKYACSIVVIIIFLVYIFMFIYIFFNKYFTTFRALCNAFLISFAHTGQDHSLY